MLAIHLSAVATPDDQNHEFLVVNLVDDPIVARPNAPFAVSADQLFTGRWTRRFPQDFHGSQNACLG